MTPIPEVSIFWLEPNIGSLTQSLETPLVGYELLSTSKTHLLEASTNAEDDAANDHLIDTLSGGSNKSSDSSRDSTEHEKPSSAHNIGDASANTDNHSSSKVPA